MAALEILLFLAFPLCCYAFALSRDMPEFALSRDTPDRDGPDTLRGRVRARGWGLLLPVLGLLYAAMSAGSHVLVVAEVLGSGLIMVFAPRAAAKLVPFALLGLGVIGCYLIWTYRHLDNSQVMYGFVLAGAGSWRTRLVFPQTLLFLVAGCWVYSRVDVPGSDELRRAAARWLRGRARGLRRGQELLLLPVLVFALFLFGPDNWFRIGWWGAGTTVAVGVLAAIGAVLLILRSRVWAATLAVAGLLVLGGYGVLLYLDWPGLSGYWYGLTQLDGYVPSMKGCALQGAALFALGLWLVPGVMGEHLGTRAEVLEQRVRTLTRSRADAVDTAAAELRRIERDLHDGAQARLVVLGMCLQAAERLFRTSPDAAMALVSEAKEASSQALTELRDLVRGIYPPVLADRGLADAIRSLAMDSPLHAIVDADLPGDVDLPVGSAVYFAVAEILTNAAVHADARSVRVEVEHHVGMLRVRVTDDGSGGADPDQGTGLTGIERRLATFDGILAVSSPPGGPTIVTIEVPCALSSPKISTC